MDLRGRPAEQADDCCDLVGLGEPAPVEVHLVGRTSDDDVPDAVELGVAEQRVGVHLQRPLADDGAVALVVEVALHLPLSTNRLTAGTLACFIDSTTSLSSAWLKPSIRRLYAGRPAQPMPKPVLPTTSRRS